MYILFFILLLVIHQLNGKVFRQKRGSAPQFDFSRYHDFGETEDYLRRVAALNPEFVRLRTIGFTYEGRNIIGLKIGYPAHATNKRIVWLDGGNHAREWPAFHLALFFINELVTKYGVDKNITDYVDKLNIYVFPVLNPDGFEFSRTSTASLVRQWRKNRSPKNCTGTVSYRKNICCEGVDLNRNFDFAFKQANEPYNNPCSDEYQGPYPFSEPESRAVRDFITGPEVKDKVDALVSMHTHGQFFLLPYNHKRDTYPVDIEDLRKLAIRVAQKIQTFRGTDYQIGTAADMMGPATGGATDWIKKFTTTKYVYVIELPPQLKTWFAFQMRPHWLIPTAEETWRGVRVIIEQVIAERKL